MVMDVESIGGDVAEPLSHQLVPSGASVDSLAYVIYTSGSTGRPKGAMVTQRGMVNHLFAKLETLQLKPMERIAQTASASFDISVWQFLVALLVGGQVCVIADEIAHNPGLLFARVREQDLTVLELVPSLLQAALDEVMEQGESVPVPLRWMLVTGENCPRHLVDQWRQCYAPVPLVNAYGPTECSDDVTHAVLYPREPLAGASMPIGSPIVNTQIYILDAGMQPLPVGVPGEIFVGGVAVGRGYLNEPA